MLESQQVQVAIQNANHMQATTGFKKTRSGYIRSAIEDRYSLIQAIGQAEVKAAKDKERSERAAVAREENRRRERALESINEILGTIGPDELEALRQEALADPSCPPALKNVLPNNPELRKRMAHVLRSRSPPLIEMTAAIVA